MKTFFHNLKGGFTFGFWVILMVLIAGTIYAGVNNIWTNPKELEASVWNSLTSEKWNKILSNQNILQNKQIELDNSIEGALAVPKWWVLAFNLDSCPSGWLPADWDWGRIDLRGIFIRWSNNFGTGESNRDLDRWTSNWVWTYQGDAIRNISWNLDSPAEPWYQFLWDKFTSNWVFSSEWIGSKLWIAENWTVMRWLKKLNFDASLVVPTGSDNRPKNIALIYCIKS